MIRRVVEYLQQQDHVDLRDVVVFGGIAMMGYGLWLFRPWIAFAVCGAVIFRIGYGPFFGPMKPPFRSSNT